MHRYLSIDAALYVVIDHASTDKTNMKKPLLLLRGELTEKEDAAALLLTTGRRVDARALVQ